MRDKTLFTLEFDKIKELLVKNAMSQMGKELAREMLPVNSFEQVNILQTQTKEASEIIEKRASSPIDRYVDVRGTLGRLKLQAVLSMRELLDMATFLKAVRFARRGITDGNDEKEGIVLEMARLLVPFRDIEEEIYADILSEDEMADSASSQLASIRRQIRSQNESIREKLNSLVKALDKDGVLQEAIITLRSDRYVLPVIAAHKGRVPGIVHDQSASGATLFIEPMAVVEINNTIRQLKLEERDEIQRILENFSRNLYENIAALESNNNILSQLDLIFAKAKLGREMDAVMPKLNKKGFVNIKSGRHPLLDFKTAVPISVWLGKEFTQLLITGPNTGGKTVTLKTIGLFALMTQSGLFLPALQGTEMPVFEDVFADIGDEQSIQQSLSTFSSHMKNIATIMKEVTPDSLVLLDELGAGTDPTEGAALAMSILEELRRKRIRTVVTSHYAELKAYSLSHAGAENASVEFDVISLKPTYKLMVGVPGNSNAFLISAKLGLEKPLIDRARSYVDEDSRKLNKVLSNAEEYRIKAQENRSEAEQMKQEISLERKKLEQERKALDREKEKLLRSAEKEADKIKENALKEAQRVIEKLRELESTAEPSAIFKAREVKKELEKKQEKKEEITVAGTPIKEFLLGMDVYIESLETDGVLLKLPNSKGKALVQAGIIQMEIDAKQLTVPKNSKKKQASSVKIHREHSTVPMSLDLRGQLADEAVINTDMYLDLAFGRNLHVVTIIHGKGTGALKKAITDFLRSDKRVKAFRAGAYGEGDGGVTVVELKN